MKCRTRPGSVSITSGAEDGFGAAVPAAYFTTYFVATIVSQGTWWNWSLIVGAIVWAAIAGVAVTFLVEVKRPLDNPAPRAS